MGTRTAVALLCLSILVSAPVGLAAGPSASDGAGDAESTDVRDVVDRLPSEDGRVRVTAVVAVPERVTELSVRTPPNASVERAEGFVSAGERWRWNGDEATASLTYTTPVGLETAYGRRTGDTADWSLVVRRELSLRARWRWQGGPDPGWNETLAVAPGQSGVATRTAAFLGPHETATRTTAAGTVRLVIPDAATLRADRATVLDTLADAQRRATVGDAHDRVTVFATPNDLAVGGYTPADGLPTALVNAGEPVASPTNVWVHEFRHTRQRYRASDGMAWLGEGSAEYYAARTTLRQGHIDYDRYRRRVSTDRYHDANLSQPSSWASPDAQYDKGARVIAAIDAHVRRATGGKRTFAAVLRRLSRSDEPVTLSLFAETVSAVAGRDLDAFVRHAVTGPAPPVPTDPDGDGVPTGEERQRGTDPYRVDAGGQNGTERRADSVGVTN